MGWLTLALLSAFALATADALTKKFLTGYHPLELVVIRFCFTTLFLFPLLLVLPWPRLPPAFWWWVGAAIPLEILAMFLYMRAITTSALAETVPYMAFTPVFNVLTQYIFLGETVTVKGFGGILLVLLGAWVLNIVRPTKNLLHALGQPVRALFNRRGSRLMLAVAFLYSLTSVFGKGALEYADPVFFGPFYFCLLSAVTLPFVVFLRPQALRTLRGRLWPHLAIGLAMAVMVASHFMAIAHVQVAYMIAIKRTSLLFGILYGAAIFGERGLGRNLAAGSLMLAGVFLIAG